MLESGSDFHPRNIYVAGLPDGFTDEALGELFGQFGSMTSVKMMTHHVGKKHIGFVLFDHEDSATAALRSLSGHVLEGERLQIRKARISAPPSRGGRPATRATATTPLPMPPTNEVPQYYAPQQLQYQQQQALPPIHYQQQQVPMQYVNVNPQSAYQGAYVVIQQNANGGSQILSPNTQFQQPNPQSPAYHSQWQQSPGSSLVFEDSSYLSSGKLFGMDDGFQLPGAMGQTFATQPHMLL
jgi:RNA recognition motif-containing protein